MIEYIKGNVAEITPTYTIIETGNIGYMLSTSLSTFENLRNSSGQVKILVHEVIREDAHLLYGFFTAGERDMFRLLIGVSGVGPNTAILILSSFPASELEAIITSGDHNRLKNVKGIGLKTAQRIIVDLKDKIKPTDPTLSLQSDSPGISGEVYDEALAALTALGFARQQSQKALKRIFDADPAVKVETAIKKALSMM
ncbi:MAG: Holliday junction branch migration protein RuvA [Duncaniella sp.]|uniref:Holliday junction branch migration protein RuvA n=1 Tax=Duncaniella sp. TaxID=2518496 RepID=UPI0023D3F02C|nr:Holliday junction branch migration protein RuvA [Duncaniella sp.]MDE5989110.1 Holliday junction branch migration protein RuvA [Duncaniella sp.]